MDHAKGGSRPAFHQLCPQQKKTDFSSTFTPMCLGVIDLFSEICPPFPTTQTRGFHHIMWQWIPQSMCKVQQETVDLPPLFLLGVPVGISQSVCVVLFHNVYSLSRLK